MNLKPIFFLLFFLISSNLWAQSSSAQFNFDETYEGENTVLQKEREDLVYDPLEIVNRPIFQFNEYVDRYVALPVTRQYRRFIPDMARKSVHNFVTNIYTPFSVVNSILQGDGTNAMASFSSFLINTTVGVGGLFDVAGSKKINYSEEDLGQTLGTYGISSGPYLVLPFLGPSNLRDFSGFAIEKAVDPLSFNTLEIGGSKQFIDDAVLISFIGVRVLDERSNLVDTVDDVRKNSFDIYATIRSAYLQQRESLITNK